MDQRDDNTHQDNNDDDTSYDDDNNNDNNDYYYYYDADYDEDYDDMMFDWACTLGHHQSSESQPQVFHDRRKSTKNLLQQQQRNIKAVRTCEIKKRNKTGTKQKQINFFYFCITSRAWTA